MHPGDFTVLVRACTAVWICIPAEQEDSNMVMSTQWYAKNNVSNIFIYSYITGQPLDVEGSSIGRRGVEGLSNGRRGVEGRSRGRVVEGLQARGSLSQQKVTSRGRGVDVEGSRGDVELLTSTGRGQGSGFESI